MAVLLGAKWAAPPYRGGADVLPTPPGSGLHFALEPSGELAVRFVYPVYVPAEASGGGAAAAVNQTGVLEASAVELAGPPLVSLQALKQTVSATLAANDDARKCFERAVAQGDARRSR